MKKRLVSAVFLVGLLCLVFPSALALDMPQVSFSAALPKTSFNAGESVDMAIDMLNGENPLIDGTMVIRLVQLNESKEIKNTLVEDAIKNLNLRVGEEKRLQHSLKIPTYAAPGDYRVDLYLITPRMSIKGVTQLSINALSYDASVKNQNYKSIRIDIDKTTVCGKLDLFLHSFPDAKEGEVKEMCFEKQLGPTVMANSIAKGNVVLVNDGDKDEQNLKVRWKVYKWNDFGDIISEKEYDVALLKAGEEKTVQVEFTTPEAPTAYSIRIELADAEGNLLSLHNSRIVIGGTSSRINLLTLNKDSYAAGDTVIVSASALAPADLVSRLDGQRRLIVKNNINNEVVFDEKERMSIEPNSLSEKAYEFKALKDLSDFTATFSVLDSDGDVLDEYSVHISPSIFERQTVITAEFFSDLRKAPDNYFAPGKVFVKASILDDIGNKLNIPVDMFYSFDNYNIGPVKVYDVEELELKKEGIYEFLFRAEDVELKKEIIVSSEPKLIIKEEQKEEVKKIVEKPTKSKIPPSYIIVLVLVALIIISILIFHHRRGSEI